MSTATVTHNTGYYGKVPVLGDFIKHNLPRSFIEPWDDWLQQAINASKMQLGENWLDTYLTSPIYRFALSPGICSDHCWQGVMMPSVDRVGRYFPMTLCRKNEAGTNPLTLALDEKAWFDRAQQLIQWALEDDFDTLKFNDQLNNLEIDGLIVDSKQETGNSDNRHLALRWGTSPEVDLITRMPEMLHKVLLECSFAYSVWWTDGSEEVEPSILICQGLPPLNSATALLDGNWDQWGWSDADSNDPFDL